METPVAIMWFRRDLRLDDNAALYYALKSGTAVLPVFIFDKNILDELQDKHDSRVSFIHDTVSEMNRKLHGHGSNLSVFYDKPAAVFRKLFNEFKIDAVFTNADHEQYAHDRDEEIAELCKKHKATFTAYKDQVIFKAAEVVKDNGDPYSVFTPYSRKWKEKLNDFYLKPYPTEKYFARLAKQKKQEIITLKQMGFAEGKMKIPSPEFPRSIISNYNKTRDVPGIEGTSRLGIHLRFGTISIRKLAAYALKHNQVYLNELIWRDFYQMVLASYAHVRKGQSFKKEYDGIKWRNNEKEFNAWCTGKTGYPMVDAGMRQLNETGFMHNRVRMITASFLTKHLLIDWRWGEEYFGEKLLDYDYASNNGGWQWAAGSGCDAAPYFRVFNPTLQQQKFDPELKYIKQWVKEFNTPEYPQPIVDHKEARERALKVYGAALKK